MKKSGKKRDVKSLSDSEQKRDLSKMSFDEFVKRVIRIVPEKQKQS